MPAVDDQIKIQVITEMQGVQMSTDLFFTVVDLDGGPTIPNITVDVLARWQAAWQSVCSDQFRISCGVFSNLTDPTEPSIPSFVNLPGLDAINLPHPADQVVWCTRYGRKQGDGTLVHGRVALSGITLNHSRRGRVVDDMELSTVEAFFKNPVTGIINDFTLEPGVRYEFSPGPPPVYEVSPIEQAVVQGVFSKLASRRTNLCASA